jgi:hypothetical protein
MTNEEIRLALLNIAPEAKYNLSGDEYTNIEWLSDFTIPTLEEIRAEIELLPEKKAQADAEIKAKRETALAKLAALGLTVEDLKALGF